MWNMEIVSQKYGDLANYIWGEEIYKCREIVMTISMINELPMWGC